MGLGKKGPPDSFATFSSPVSSKLMMCLGLPGSGQKQRLQKGAPVSISRENRGQEAVRRVSSLDSFQDDARLWDNQKGKG